jgi:hypothetical protein
VKHWGWGLLVGAVVIAVWVAWGLFSVPLSEIALQGKQAADAGTWGDSFGGLNALFSALGFTAVLLTLIFQSQALQAQAADLHRQRFESSFFELLGLLRELRKEVRFRFSEDYRKSVLEGKKSSFVSQAAYNSERGDHDAIASAVREMRHWITHSGKMAVDLTADELAKLYLKRVHGGNESRLGPYFRMIYTILARIRDDSFLSKEDKVRYGNLLRSQLTSHEIALLAINGLAPISANLAELLTEFRMLKYQPHGLMRRTLERMYKPEAFMGRG